MERGHGHALDLIDGPEERPQPGDHHLCGRQELEFVRSNRRDHRGLAWWQCVVRGVSATKIETRTWREVAFDLQRVVVTSASLESPPPDGATSPLALRSPGL